MKKVRQRNTNIQYYLFVEFLKNNISELIYKTDVDSQIETKHVSIRGRGKGTNEE